MLGMISAAIGAMVLFASQRAFPDINERFKSFSSIGYLLLAGAFAVSGFNGIFFTRNRASNTMSAPSLVRKKWSRIRDITPIYSAV